MPATPTTANQPDATSIKAAHMIGMVYDYDAECFVPESAIADYDAHLARHADRLYAECNGERYPINPDAPDEGDDIRHTSPCPSHGEDVGLRIANRIRNGR